MALKALMDQLNSDNIKIYNVGYSIDEAQLPCYLKPQSLQTRTPCPGSYSHGSLGGFSVDWQSVPPDIPSTLALIELLPPTNPLATMEYLSRSRPVSPQ